MTEVFTFEYKIYDTIADLHEDERTLFAAAKKSLIKSYAPYSHFRVAAAARLCNNQIIDGTNQENSSFPVGICAERSMLAVLSSIFPEEKIKTIALTFKNEQGKSDFPITPCGMCRQALLETEMRQKQSIQIILGGSEGGKIYVLPSVQVLLPLAFHFS